MPNLVDREAFLVRFPVFRPLVCKDEAIWGPWLDLILDEAHRAVDELVYGDNAEEAIKYKAYQIALATSNCGKKLGLSSESLEKVQIQNSDGMGIACRVI